MYKLLSTLLVLLITVSPVASDATALTIYTYDSFVSEWGPGPQIEKAFEARCDCEITFVGLDDGATILNRVRLEGKGSPADIVLGLDTNLMAEAEATGLLAPSHVDNAPLKLPIAWTSKVFVPYDYGYFAFVYDTEALPDPPGSLKELIEGEGDYKIILQDPRTSTPGLGFLLWMRKVYGDEAAKYWKKLQPRILTVTRGWSEAYFALFLKGEAPIVLSYSTSPAYHMAVDKTDRYQAAAFSEGHYLQVEVAALLKQSKNPQLAREFLQFIYDDSFQSVLPLTNVMFPVTDIGDALPEEFNRLLTPSKTLLYSPEEVADNRKAWIDEWLDVMSQ